MATVSVQQILNDQRDVVEEDIASMYFRNFNNIILFLIDFSLSHPNKVVSINYILSKYSWVATVITLRA